MVRRCIFVPFSDVFTKVLTSHNEAYPIAFIVYCTCVTILENILFIQVLLHVRNLCYVEGNESYSICFNLNLF